MRIQSRLSFRLEHNDEDTQRSRFLGRRQDLPYLEKLKVICQDMAISISAFPLLES